MINLFKKLRPFLLIIMILLVGLGLYSFKTMPKESAPAINIPFFTITSIYPGADAKSVEEQVVQKIEDKLNSVANLSTYKSISTNNVAAFTVEFKRGTSKDTAYNDLKSAIDEVKSSLPSDVNVIIKKSEVTDLPVYIFSIIGDYYPSLIYDKIRNLETQIQQIPGVDHVDVIGKYVPEVQIRFNYDKLKKYNISYSQLVGILGSLIVDQPIDKKQLNGLLYSFKVQSYGDCKGDLISKLECFKKELENDPILNVNGNELKLKDIADVIVSHPFFKKRAYVDGQSAVTYMVYKTDGVNMLDLVANLKKFLESKEAYFKENGLHKVDIFFRTDEVKKTFDTFTSNFRQTALIILLVIGLFVGLKEAVSVFLAFPLVYLITFIYLHAIGYGFNSIVSFSLVLTLGIMVDNLIVIIEGFDEGIKKGLDKLKAIEFSIKTYWKPLLAGNLTTIAMFFPLNFMLSGKIGEFMKYMPTTVDGTLVFSMIVAFVFLPLILTFVYRKGSEEGQKRSEEKKTVKSDRWKVESKKRGQRIDSEDYQKIENEDYNLHKNKSSDNHQKKSSVIPYIIKSALKKPKKIILTFWLLFFVTLLVFVKFGKVDFLPPTDKNNIYVNIQYDKAISLQENSNYTNKIYLWTKDFFQKNYPGIVKHIQITIGDYTSFSPLDKVVYRNSFNPDLSTLNISLIDTDKRPSWENAVKIYPKLREFLLEKIKENKINSVKDLSAFIKKNGPSAGKDITFYIKKRSEEGQNRSEEKKEIGEKSNLSDIEVLAQAYEKILPKLKQIPGTYDWTSSLEYSNGKITIQYDMDKIRQYNLNARDISLFLLSLYSKNWDYLGNGVEITKLNSFGKDLIPVKSYVFTNDSGLNFNSIIIPGTNIYLSQVVKKVTLNPDLKYYQHLDGVLVVKVQAFKNPDITLGAVKKEIAKIISSEKDIELTYGSDIKDMQQSMKDLAMAFVVGLFLMFSVLVLQFGNYKQPLIVFSIIPLLFIGAFILLLIFKIPFGFAAQLGMFGLIGVGVNNAILLIDRYNELRRGQKIYSEDYQKIKGNTGELEDRGISKSKGEYQKITENIGEGNHSVNPDHIDEVLENVILSRLKPVFLTTLTTVLGLVTLAIKDELWGSLALSFMGGLILGTLITLIYIPAMLKLAYKKN